jgi:predicted phosphodiesterase
MRLGLLADIHGDIDNLKKVLARLSAESVDRFVVLGDVIYDSRDASETVAILNDIRAIGVWGNHELGVAVQPDEEVGELFSDEVLEFFSQLSPLRDLGDVLLSHSLPTIDALDPVAYYTGPRATDLEAANACFTKFGHRIFLTGHLHRWFASTAGGHLAWDGSEPVQLLPEERYLFVIHAVMDGYAALLDTDRFS